MSQPRLRSVTRAVLGGLAAAALAAMLAGCGGGGSDAPAAAATTAPPGSTTTPVTTATPTGETTTPLFGGSTPAPVATLPPDTGNVLAIVMDKGTDGSALNAPFVRVTVCEPGSQACRTIDHILVDTGSVGLRLSASALDGLSLPPATSGGAGAYGECASFASGYTWGSVRTADVRLADEHADALPVQVYDDRSTPFATVPTACSNTGVALDPAGSNGILGVGFAARDCGSACANSALPGMYFSCTASGCTAAAAPLASQVANPVALLAGANNNGVAILLPAVPLGGVPSLAGSLVMGIGTGANNQLGDLGIFTANSAGNFTTTYRGRTSSAFIDSGSNGIFFPDSTIPRCGSGFYCPPSPLTLSATVTGANGNARSVPFAVENAAALPGNTGAAHLGGSIVLGRSFDWGAPFFFGRSVFLAFTGKATPQGTGPFWAF